MKRTLRIVLVGILAVTQWFQVSAKNGDNDDPTKSAAQPTGKVKKYSKYRTFMPAQYAVDKQVLVGAEEQIKNLENISYNADFSPSAAFLADIPVSEATESERDKAKKVFDDADGKGYWLDGDVQNAPPLQPLKLPLGIKKHFGQNNIVYLAFSKAVIKPTHAEITAFVKMEMYVNDGQAGTTKKREIFFGADKIKLTNNGRIVGDVRLVLLGDYTIPMFKGKMKMILKGGKMSETDGGIVDSDKTYAIIDCNGFREAAITADAIFDRKVLLPLDRTSLETTGGEVTAHMRIEGQTNLNDILGKMTFETPFTVTGHDNWAFEVDNMFFDASAQRNYSGITMLDEYLGKFPEEEGAGAWKGFGLNTFKLYLPKEFKKDGVSNRVAISVNKLIIDEEGISCNIGAIVSDYGLDKGKTNENNAWRMSLNNFHLTFERSKLIGGSFGGEIRLPVSKTGSGDNYVYNATIDFRGNYSLKVNPMEQIDFSIFKAKAVLGPQSFVELAVKDHVFLPKASLTGYFVIDADEIKKEGSSTPINQKTKQQVTFQELELTTVSPFIKLKYAGYDRRSEVANFPVSIDNFSVKITNNGQLPAIALEGGMSMNMMGESKGETETSMAPSGEPTPNATTSSTPSGFSVKSVFKVKASMHMEANGIQRWQFDDLTITPSGLNASIGKYKLVGELELFDDDRGKGFSGTVQFSKKEKGQTNYELVGACLAMFGNKKEANGDGTRYWIVEAFLDVKLVQLGPVELRGVGGGLYHHMYPAKSGDGEKAVITSTTFGQPVKYWVNKDIKLGFKVVTGMKLPKVESFKGLVGFEITFNQNWGINTIGLFGNATLAAKFKGLDGGNLLNTIGEKFANMSNRAASLPGIQVLSKSKLIEKANSEFNTKDEGTDKEGQISLKVSLLYQSEKDELHGEGEVYINASVMTGVGNKGKAGWFVMHFDPKEWYIHAGNPYDRVGVKFNLGIAKAMATAYFMVGHRIPPMPPPPPQMISLLGSGYSAAPINSRNDAEVSTGRGVAFGASLSVSTGDLRAAIFYARLDAGLGFDAMLSKGNHNCTGIDGWYARGQAYAYVTGEIGITVKVAFIKKNFSILSAGAGVLLQVGLPNPAWFRGNVVGRYSVLGGAVKGNFNIKMAIGEECGNTMMVTTPPNEMSDTQEEGSNSSARIASARATQEVSSNTIATPLILSYTPVDMPESTETDYTYTYEMYPDGSYKRNTTSKELVIKTQTNPVVTVYKNIQSVFVTPTITFNGSVGKPYELIDANGNRKLYRIKIKEVGLKKGASSVAFDTTWSSQREVMTIVPSALLTKKSDYTFKVEVVLEQDINLNNVWTTVPDAGRADLKDIRTVAFVTGDDDPKIPSNNIAYTYPVIDQEYFYKEESSVGIVKLKRNQPLIAAITSSSIRKVAKFVSTSGVKIEVPFTCTANTISYTIPAALDTNKRYNVQFNYWPVSGKDSIVTLLSYDFSVSKYKTLQAKLNSANNEWTIAYKGNKNLTKDMILLNSKANYGEPFDAAELVGNAYSGGKMLQAQVRLTDSYYLNSIVPLLYKDNLFNTYYPEISNLTKMKNEVFASNWYMHNQKWKTATDSVKRRQPYVYSVTRLFTEDFENLQGILAEKYYSDASFKTTYNSNSNLKDRTDNILIGRVPYLENGSYTVDISAKLPSATAYTSKKDYIYTINGLIDNRGSLVGIPPESQSSDTYYVLINFLDGALKNYCPSPLTKLVSTSKVYNGARLVLNAELEITLEEDFEAEEGSDFEAEIKACTNL